MYRQHSAPAVVQVSANPMDWDDYDMENISTVFFNRSDIDALNPHLNLKYEGR